MNRKHPRWDDIRKHILRYAAWHPWLARRLEASTFDSNQRSIIGLISIIILSVVTWPLVSSADLLGPSIITVVGLSSAALIPIMLAEMKIALRTWGPGMTSAAAMRLEHPILGGMILAWSHSDKPPVIPEVPGYKHEIIMRVSGVGNVRVLSDHDLNVIISKPGQDRVVKDWLRYTVYSAWAQCDSHDKREIHTTHISTLDHSLKLALNGVVTLPLHHFAKSVHDSDYEPISAPVLMIGDDAADRIAHEMIHGKDAAERCEAMMDRMTGECEKLVESITDRASIIGIDVDEPLSMLLAVLHDRPVSVSNVDYVSSDANNDANSDEHKNEDSHDASDAHKNAGSDERENDDSAVLTSAVDSIADSIKSEYDARATAVWCARVEDDVLPRLRRLDEMLAGLEDDSDTVSNAAEDLDLIMSNVERVYQVASE